MTNLNSIQITAWKSTIHNWWRQGESPDAIVYRRWWRMLIGSSIAIIIGLIYCPPLRIWEIYCLFVFYTMRSCLERRRAIIFNGEHLIYRFPIRHIQTIRIKDITAIEKCTITLLYGLHPIWVIGVKFHLINGQDWRLPLDFPHRQAIVDRLTTVLCFPRLDV